MNPDAAPPVTSSADDEFQAELRKACLDSAPQEIDTMRKSLQTLAKDVGNKDVLQNLYRRVHSMAGNAGIAGLQTIARVASAFEDLLRELQEKPERTNPSVLRTVAQTVDSLATFFRNVDQVETGKSISGRVLVVDDEGIARRAVVHAISKVKLEVVEVSDPLEALRVAAKQEFDLITLDIEMPGMTGLELCSKLVAMPQYQATPVIFVTTLSDFEHRAQICLRGANDLIGKPFLYTELAVKALTLCLKFQLFQKRLGVTK